MFTKFKILNVNFDVITMLLAFMFAMVQASPSYKLEITSYRHIVNSDFIKEISIKLTNYSDHQAINGSVKLGNDIDYADLKVKATLINSAGRKFTPLNFKTNACDILNGTGGTLGQLFAVFYKKVKETAFNLPEKCPVLKDTELGFINFHVDVETMPALAARFPDVMGHVFIGFSKDDVDIYKGFISGKVLQKN